MSVVTPTMSTTIQRQSWGAQTVVFGTLAFGATGYDQVGGGDVITPADFGLLEIDQMVLEPTAGYMLNYIEATGRVKVYLSAGGSGTTGGTSGGAAVINAAASNASSAVTAKMNYGTPVFSGTGFATAGQVITTTDNQTMPAVDTAAGLWFIADGLPASPAVMVTSNTIVAGAPAVLTCNGVPPVTDAGAYRLVGITGTAAAQVMTQATFSAPATHTHTTAGGTAGEVPNGTNISALTAVTFIAIGR